MPEGEQINGQTPLKILRSQMVCVKGPSIQLKLTNWRYTRAAFTTSTQLLQEARVPATNETVLLCVGVNEYPLFPFLTGGFSEMLSSVNVLLSSVSLGFNDELLRIIGAADRYWLIRPQL